MARISNHSNAGRIRFTQRVPTPGTGVGQNRIQSFLLFVSVCLAGCAGPPPVPVEERDGVDVHEQVREPARQESAGVQVYPLQNPAVKELLAQASEAETRGDFEAAAVALERALRIQPRDPEILQRMAEVQVQKKDYEQALNFAVRSYDIGPRVGEICSRNWRTIAVAREQLGDANGSRQAATRAGECMSTKPRGY